MLKAKHVYRETYRLNSNDDEVSIKLVSNQSIDTTTNIATTFDQSYITQFEYTYTSYISFNLFYDIFNVDEEISYSFVVYDFEFDETTKDCQRVVCFANNFTCSTIYTISSDNYATHECESNNTLILTLCLKINRINEYLESS